jgi:hypothetical protein
MHQTHNEHDETRKRLNQMKEVIAQQRKNIKKLGLSDDQIDYAIQPCLCFRDQLQEELDSHQK